MANMIRELEEKAIWLRRKVLEKVAETGKGHIGGTFSCIDILIALYYGNIMRIDARNPLFVDRDRLVIGKGHVCLAIYNILVDLGFIEISKLNEFGKDGSKLGGQLNIDTPGVEYNTGSLGHAIGIAAGMALAAKMDNLKYRVYAIIGDGECDEGSIWESIMFAGKMRLSNLIGIIDRNKLSVTDVVEDHEGSGNLCEKIRACGWHLKEIDGHSFEQIFSGFNNYGELDKPLMVVANTIKGKGVSFMEDVIKWHHSVPSQEEFDKAMKEIGHEI